MLPQVMPMLAVATEPFDSPDYSFEIKYDGVRALAAVDGSGWRLWGRERADYTPRYPEFEVLRRLPAGTLVDGELVACDPAGRPDLRSLLRRHGLTDPWRMRQARRWCPLVWRRQALAELCRNLDVPAVVFSPAVIGQPYIVYKRGVFSCSYRGVERAAVLCSRTASSHVPPAAVGSRR